MSRIGKKPVQIPDGVKVEIKKEEAKIIISGKNGSNTLNYEPDMVDIILQGNTITVQPKANEKPHKARWGLYARLIKNALTGVVTPFTKQLEINGVGYTVSVSGSILHLTLGYSHGIAFVIPPEVKCQIKQEKGKNPVIVLTSHDKYLVGEVAALIRKLRPVNVYSGKGIKYVDEVITLKEGKKAGK